MGIISKIKALMEENEVSKSDLEKVCGLANGVILKWEKELQKPSTDAIVKIANYFNVSTDYLLGTSDDPTILSIKQEPLSQKEKEALEVVEALGEIGVLNLDKELQPQVDAFLRFIEGNKDFFLALKEKQQ